ncbi:hypothetical protein BJ508DRAFT_365508 [Ascobolus immersus RN42]|uniref:BTB domain-containing protein n=1 Tax=Ascobolus immersus RN42 TaxID=1160509 RepID=A0A3N4HT26_ASCIM|nr:hypothetical protein BJ508DRAFT_365508 [Ascobolus immersus RN42]
MSTTSEDASTVDDFEPEIPNTTKENPSTDLQNTDNASDDEAPISTPPDSRPPSPSNDRNAKTSTSSRPVFESLDSACRRLFLNETFSDMTVVEAEDGVINIQDETPKNIYRLLQYLYTKKYYAYPSQSIISKNSFYGPQQTRYTVRTHLTMIRLADKFLITGLDLEARERLTDFLRDFTRYCCQKEYEYLEDSAKYECLRLASNIALKVYRELEYDEEEDADIRLEAMDAVFKMLKLANPSAEKMKECDDLQTLIEEHSDFAFELIEKMLVTMPFR